MNSILLSVIIPTKNRYFTLIPVLESLRKYIKDSRIEFVVQDNSDNNDEMVLYLNRANDSRIKYFYEAKNIDVVANFNSAIKHAVGTYFTLIGDDDLVSPYIMNAIDIIYNAGINCLIYPRGTYYWPDVEFIRESVFFEPASIQVIKEPSMDISEFHSEKELKYVLSMGGIYLYNLPALYHGIVKKEIVDSIYEKHGTYVLGPSPDISMAVCLAYETPSYHYMNFPLSIPGASFNSAAGMGRRGDHSALLEEMPDWLPKEIIQKWDPNLPRIWNGYTVYAQSIFMVLQSKNIHAYIDYIKLYEKLLKSEFRDIAILKKTEYFKQLPFYKRMPLVAKSYLMYMAKEFLLTLPVFLVNFVVQNLSYFKKRKHVIHINSVDSCMEWLTKEYKRYF